jgi:hypothetical protein
VRGYGSCRSCSIGTNLDRKHQNTYSTSLYEMLFVKLIQVKTKVSRSVSTIASQNLEFVDIDARAYEMAYDDSRNNGLVESH